MMIGRELGKFVRYLLGKRSELEDLDLKDVIMAEAILEIHRTKTSKNVVNVPLFALKRIHKLDRKNAIEATARRVEALEEHKAELLATRTLTCDDLARYLPSVSWIKSVRESTDSYLAFEGNGRIAAMQAVFAREDGIEVEVELYECRRPSRILRRLNRVRRLNGLLPREGS